LQITVLLAVQAADTPWAQSMMKMPRDAFHSL